MILERVKLEFNNVNHHPYSNYIIIQQTIFCVKMYYISIYCVNLVITFH